MQVEGLALILTWAICALLVFLLLHATEQKSRDSRISDFAVFYATGEIARQNPQEIYSAEPRASLVKQMFPKAEGVDEYCHFSYPPFVALSFAPLSRLDYWTAYRIQQTISVLLYLAGLAFLVRTFLRGQWSFVAAFIPIALAFLPFLFDVVAGQLAAVGFFSVSLALSQLKEGRRFASGLALSLCLYKPTLLVLIVPMLLFRRQWRSLAGFVSGGVALALTAAIPYGPRIYGSYVQYLFHSFGQIEGPRNLVQYADLDAFWTLLAGPRPGIVLTALCAVILLPFVVNLWQRTSEEAWPITIIATLLLVPYVPIYDTILIIPALLCNANLFRFNKLPLLLPILLLGASWVSQMSAGWIHLQILTLMLAMVAVRQIWSARGAPLWSKEDRRGVYCDC